MPTHVFMRQISHIAPAGLLAAAITLVGTGLAIGDSAKSVSQALLAVAAICFIAMAFAGAQRDHARK